MTTRMSDLEQVWATALSGPGRVLAKFSAPWCGPCKAMEPYLQQLEADEATPPVVRVDVEAAPGLAARYGIRAMPTLMLLEDGEPVKTVVGLQTHGQLVNLLSR